MTEQHIKQLIDTSFMSHSDIKRKRQDLNRRTWNDKGVTAPLCYECGDTMIKGPWVEYTWGISDTTLLVKRNEKGLPSRSGIYMSGTGRQGKVGSTQQFYCMDSINAWAVRTGYTPPQGWVRVLGDDGNTELRAPAPKVKHTGVKLND